MRVSNKDRARFAALSAPFKVVNGRKFRLRDYDPGDTLHLESSDLDALVDGVEGVTAFYINAGEGQVVFI